MIKSIEELMEAPMLPHIKRLLKFMFDGYTFESAKKKVLDEINLYQPFKKKWEDL